MIRPLLAILVAAFAVLIAVAVYEGGFSEAGAWLMANRWGQVTLADLYLGFFLSAVVIGFFEKSPLVAALWILPIPFIGNLWTGIWFLIRFRYLRDRLSHR